MPKKKCWVKWDKNRFYNKTLDKIVVLQEKSNIMFIMDGVTGKTSQTPPAPNRKVLVNFANKYMREHNKCVVK